MHLPAPEMLLHSLGSACWFMHHAASMCRLLAGSFCTTLVLDFLTSCLVLDLRFQDLMSLPCSLLFRDKVLRHSLSSTGFLVHETGCLGFACGLGSAAHLALLSSL